MISNTLIRDQRLSLRAKGLYILIESFITIPGFTLYKGYLMKQCTEGSRAFDSAWKELKECGYLIQYKMRQGSNRFYYEYELLDDPMEQEVCNPLDPHFVGVENVGVQDVGIQNVGVQNVGVNNNTILNNTLPNNIVSNHIISKSAIREQIGFDTFSTEQQQIVENIVMMIDDTMRIPDKDTIRVDRHDVEAWRVKERFKLLEMGHIEYVLWMLEENAANIKNPKSYIMTMLYNAPLTMDSYMRYREMADSQKQGFISE